MKRFLPLLLAVTIIFLGCGSESKETEIKINTAKNYQLSDTLMTVEKYADMDFELASMLFEKYYEELKDKKYEEVKELYHKFLNDKELIYKKYGVTDKEKISTWSRTNKVALRDYRNEHLEINYYKKFPDFKEANIVLYNLARSEHLSKQTKE